MIEAPLQDNVTAKTISVSVTYKYWRLGRVESCTGNSPPIRVLSTLLWAITQGARQDGNFRNDLISPIPKTATVMLQHRNWISPHLCTSPALRRLSLTSLQVAWAGRWLQWRKAHWKAPSHSMSGSWIFNHKLDMMSPWIDSILEKKKKNQGSRRLTRWSLAATVCNKARLQHTVNIVLTVLRNTFTRIPNEVQPSPPLHRSTSTSTFSEHLDMIYIPLLTLAKYNAQLASYSHQELICDSLCESHFCS